MRLNPGEKVYLVLHRHIITLFFALFPFFILFILPVVFFAGYILFSSGQITINESVYFLLVLLASIYYLLVLMFSLNIFLDFILDIWTVTNQRVINIEQNGLFSRSFAEQEIARVQDVTAEVKGIAATLFGYGDVYIQTAGTTERFIFKQVSKPYQVVAQISKLLERSPEK